MKAIYRFPIDIFYQNDDFRRISDMMEKFGAPMQVGLGGSAGQTDVSLTAPGDEVPEVPKDKLKKMQEILQETYDKLLAEKEIDDIKITVKSGYRYELVK